MNPEPLPDNPVFAVGCPRSGTTLLQALLCTQPGFVSGPESHFFTICAKDLGVLEKFSAEQLPAFRETSERHSLIKLSDTFWDRLAAILAERSLNKKELFETIMQEGITKPVADSGQPLRRWIEKTPNHWRELDVIHALYPRAKFICITRHPIDSATSRKQKIAPEKDKRMSQFYDDWQAMAQTTWLFQKRNFNTLYRLRCEALTKDPEAELVKIFDFLEEPFDPARLSSLADASSHLINSKETWKQDVATGVVKHDPYRFLGKIPWLDVDTAERQLYRELESLGYPLFTPLIKRQLFKFQRRVRRLLKAFK